MGPIAMLPSAVEAEPAIRADSRCLGRFDAAAAAFGVSKSGVAGGMQVNAIVQGLNEPVLARSPSGLWGVLADFEGIAVFLASAASTFITCAALPEDGGYASEV